MANKNIKNCDFGRIEYHRFIEYHRWKSPVELKSEFSNIGI